MKRLLILLAAVGILFASCKNSKKTDDQKVEQTETSTKTDTVEKAPVVELTYRNLAGTYDTEDYQMRVVLDLNGTATWNMIGSLHWSEYSYIIKGNGVFFDVKEVDENTKPNFIYDPQKKTLDDGNGNIYILQPENYLTGLTNIDKSWFIGHWKSKKGDDERFVDAILMEEYSLDSLKSDAKFYFLKEGIDYYSTNLTWADVDYSIGIKRSAKYIDGQYEFDLYIPDPRADKRMIRYDISQINGEEVYVVADLYDFVK